MIHFIKTFTESVLFLIRNVMGNFPTCQKGIHGQEGAGLIE